MMYIKCFVSTVSNYCKYMFCFYHEKFSFDREKKTTQSLYIFDLGENYAIDRNIDWRKLWTAKRCESDRMVLFDKFGRVTVQA